MQNPLDRYDILLNDLGYQLARDQDGNVLSAAARTQLIDHFTRHVQETERWARVTFRFSGGAGIATYDGSHRYRWGDNLDTRGGRAIRGHKMALTEEEDDLWVRPNQGSTITDHEIGSAATDQGLAVRFQAPRTASVTSVSVLIKRDPEVDWGAAAATVNLRLYQDAGGPIPGAVINTVAVPWVGNQYREPLWYGCDPWQAGEHYWLIEIFPTSLLTSGNWYWVGIENAGTSIEWAKVNSPTRTVSRYTAAAWTNGTTQASPCFKINYEDELTGPPVFFLEFRGDDDYRRLFMATTDKVWYWEDDGTLGYPWKLTRTVTGSEIRAGIVFNDYLFIALGGGADMWGFTGVDAISVWGAVTNERALCYAIHDQMLWKAGGTSGVAVGGELVHGSLTGLSGTYGAAVSVGDPGTNVTALASHGGKLYAAKEEGIFEITYPNTYPATGGVPTVNLVIPLDTDRTPRRWMTSWHSGLYFPISGGVAEWKNNTVTDIWQDRVDASVQRVEPAQDQQFMGVDRAMRQYDGPRRYTPAEAVDEASRGFFMAAHGAIRGIYFAINSPHLETNGVWFWDGPTRSWHPITGKLYHSLNAGSDDTDFYLAEYILAVYLQSFGAGKGRLWYGFGHDAVRCNEPTWTRDRMLYSDVDYNRAVMLELPLFDGGDPRTIKDWWAIDVISKNAANDGRWDVQYQIDAQRGDDTNWVRLGGGLGRITASPFTRIQLPQNTVGRNIRIRIIDTGVDGAIADSLELEAVDLLYHVLPDTVVTHELLIRCATFGEHHQGQDTRTARQIRDELMALMDEQEPFTYLSLLGDEVEVKMMSCQVEIPTMLATSGEEPSQDIQFHPAPTEMWIRVLLLELEDTVESEPA